MRYVIGVDEAGYGPNLGPLVISASVWRLDEESDDRAALARPDRPRCGDESPAASKAHVLGRFSDSKQVYRPGGSLAPLETRVLAVLAHLGHRPRSWRAVWETLSGGCQARLEEIPWYDSFDEPCPVAASPNEVEQLSEQLKEQLAGSGMELVALHSRPVFVPEFNRRVAQSPSKATVLSQLSLRLVVAMLDSYCTAPATVICDKHGGRNRYFDLLAEHFPESFVEIHGESRQQSSYRVHHNGQPIGIRFAAKGERYPAVGLASLASKYLRELALRALNAFWQQRVPNLRPTAGYPQDARRFAQQIAAERERMGFDHRFLWRVK